MWGAPVSAVVLDDAHTVLFSEAGTLAVAAPGSTEAKPFAIPPLSRQDFLSYLAHRIRRDGGLLCKDTALLNNVPAGDGPYDEASEAAITHEELKRWFYCGSQSGGGGSEQDEEEPTDAVEFARAARRRAEVLSGWQDGAVDVVPLTDGWCLVQAKYGFGRVPTREDGLGRREKDFYAVHLLIKPSLGDGTQMLVFEVGRGNLVRPENGNLLCGQIVHHGITAQGFLNPATVDVYRVDAVVAWAAQALADGRPSHYAGQPDRVPLPLGYKVMDTSVQLVPAPRELGALGDVVMLPRSSFQGHVSFLKATDSGGLEASYAECSKNSRLRFIFPSFHRGPPPPVLRLGSVIFAPTEDKVGVQLLEYAVTAAAERQPRHLSQLDGTFVPDEITYTGKVMLEHLSDTRLLCLARAAETDVVIMTGSSMGLLHVLAVDAEGNIAELPALPADFDLATVTTAADGSLAYVSNAPAVHLVPHEVLAGLALAPVQLSPEMLADMSFSAYEPSCGADSELTAAAFDAAPQGSDFGHPKSRADRIYPRAKGTLGGRFWAVAGLGQTPAELRSPDYKALASTGDLADYLGAPLWFAESATPHIVQDATFGDLTGGRRSSNKISALVMSGCSTNDTDIPLQGDAATMSWRSYVFLAVVGVRPDTTAANVRQAAEGALRPPSLREINTYHAPADAGERPYFEMKSGDLLATDPAYTDVDDGVLVEKAAKGKWYVRTVADDCGSVAQLIAVHESVADDANFGGECKLPWSVMEQRRKQESESAEGRPKRAREVPKLQAMRRDQIEPEEDYWVEAGGALPDGWLPHIHGVGVDTAAAGLFDAAHYGDTSSLPPEPTTPLFSADSEGFFSMRERWATMVNVTMEERGFDLTLLPSGAASSSGYGDGCYSLHLQRQHDEIVAARIVFIWPNGNE